MSENSNTATVTEPENKDSCSASCTSSDTSTCTSSCHSSPEIPSDETLEAQRLAEANAAAVGDLHRAEIQEAQEDAERAEKGEVVFASTDVPSTEGPAELSTGEPSALYAQTSLEHVTMGGDAPEAPPVPMPREELDIPSDPSQVAVPLVPVDASMNLVPDRNVDEWNQKHGKETA